MRVLLFLVILLTPSVTGSQANTHKVIPPATYRVPLERQKQIYGTWTQINTPDHVEYVEAFGADNIYVESTSSLLRPSVLSTMRTGKYFWLTRDIIVIAYAYPRRAIIWDVEISGNTMVLSTADGAVERFYVKEKRLNNELPPATGQKSNTGSKGTNGAGSQP